MQRISRGAAIPVLGALLWIPLALAACTLPVSPGCSAAKSLPRDPEIFLTLVLVTEDRRGPAFAIDREGRSQFVGGYTVWMLTPFTTCRTIPSDDVLQLQDAWRQATEDPVENAGKPPSLPFVALGYSDPAGLRHKLYVKPDTPGQSAELETAIALTAHTLQGVYGDRVLREFQAARLADLLAPPPNEASLDMLP